MEARKVLPWCVLAGGPDLPNSDPSDQEKQTRPGRNPQRDTSCCYFYHFHKAKLGMLFPAVDTGLVHLCLQNSQWAAGGKRKGDVPSGCNPLAGSLTLQLWSLFMKGNPFWHFVNHESKTLLFFGWSLDLHHNTFSVRLELSCDCIHQSHICVTYLQQDGTHTADLVNSPLWGVCASTFQAVESAISVVQAVA